MIMKVNFSLMEQLAAPENLLTAWRAVRGNIPSYRRQRSAGPDGVTLTEYERDLPAQLNTLRQLLLSGRYTPQPPGVFTVTKADGNERRLAVLNVSDRVAQRAAQQVIEPLFEPIFLPCSFGFRPRRSIQDAVLCVRQLRQHGYRWTVDGDIANCFDTLDHRLLMRRINQKINDSRVLDLLQKWLESGVLDHGLPQSKALSSGSNGIPGSLDTLFRRFQQGLPELINPQSNVRSDPYMAARYESPISNSPDIITENTGLPGFPGYPLERTLPGGQMPARYPYTPEEDNSQRAIRQVAAGGLLLVTGWARNSLSRLGMTALTALQTPAGRQAIKRGLVAGGGVVGAAAGVALSAYFLYRQAVPPTVGVLQGSPLSPLLANVYLHPFDADITGAGHCLVRFADDWVILCPDQGRAEAAYNAAMLSLAKLRLKINPQKTRILTPDENLSWLGETIA
jgi:RNA-directed DNA polymerase